MTEICLFAGTTEGRRLAEFLEGQDVSLKICVATEYGGELLDRTGKTEISDKRLSFDDILRMMQENKYDLVIDATHPYAVQVTENIRSACKQTGTEYQRLLRGESAIGEDAVIVPDISAAVAFLDRTGGNILLTTGSKELAAFSELADFQERIYARVLPLPSSLESCAAVGLKPSHIIAMQGPFTEELNSAMLRSIRAEWLVTKESGNAGGFEEKISAARKCSAKTVIIGRPEEQSGLSESEMIKFLRQRYGFVRRPKVSVVGIGPGAHLSMTTDADQAIASADCLIGAGRMLECRRRNSQTAFETIDPRCISEFIHDHPEIGHFAVLMSGDTGFYSGTRRLLPLLTNCDVHVIPGISSLSYFCAKTGNSYENIAVRSLHGREQGILQDVRRNEKLFLLTGGENSVNAICRKLEDAGFDDLRITVGERLSYPDEKFTTGTPAELTDSCFDPLSVMLIMNDHADPVLTHGLPDEAFLRNMGEKGIVPMTKREIRSVCLSRLELTEKSLCWDVGSGTGSIAIEMALQAGKGSVCAIEKDAAALELSKRNAGRFAAENISFIHGSAPEACAELPTPTHVFIGGSSGNLKEIFRGLFSRGASMRVVVTAVTLDTVAELYNIQKSFSFAETDVTLVQTSQGRKAGSHELMIGGNPVYIFSFRISGACE